MMLTVHLYYSAYIWGLIRDDIIVVDVLHEDGIEAVEETVRGAQDAQHES